jgi:predicted TIM-barrel fold metal-dependent hydrolase
MIRPTALVRVRIFFGGWLLAVPLYILAAPSPDPPAPWRKDPLFQRIASALDPVLAIDGHTHLLRPAEFDPTLDERMPLLNRSTHPGLATAVRERFGVTLRRNDWKSTVAELDSARAAMKTRLGEHGYWMDHLDYTRTEIALVNDYSKAGTDGRRLRWVPHATTLLYPLPAERLKERSPSHDKDISRVQTELRRFLKETGREEVPPDLPSYLRFAEETLRSWQAQGAVAVKFWDAYLRTLRIADTPDSHAAELYARGRATPLSRDDYLALQDFLWRHILLEAGRRKIPVHIHSSLGVPPFLRSLESDVRNLEDILTDPRFFGTSIVLIHGGGPFYDHAAYLAVKPNVWIDISAMSFIYPVPDFAAAIRKFLLFAPAKVLFGTDVSRYPGVPGGPEIQHLVLSRSTREAIYLALAGLVEDGVIDEATAIGMGRGVLRGNAERLYGWK